MFPNNFLWGSATASYQCEGGYKQDGRGMTIWDEFTHIPGNSFNNTTGDVASDHYNRVDEDIALMKAMGHTSYRFSIAWSRILPTGRTNHINQAGIDFYSDLIDKLLDNGIEPMVTLYHWDLPLSLGQEGSWENRDIIDAFVDYARLCFEQFGDRVKLWTTFNEPTFFVKSGYLIGNYPPQVTDFRRAAIVFHHVMVASALAIKLFREKQIEGVIGVVHAYETIYPKTNSAEDLKAASIADDIYNNIVYDVVVNGVYPKQLYDMLTQKMDVSFIEADAELLKSQTVDYIGVNYYSRYVIEHYTGNETVLKQNNTGSIDNKTQISIAGLFRVVETEGGFISEWDADVYPEGLTDALLRLNKRYNGITMYVTENGIGLREKPDEKGVINDEIRVDFLRNHIKAIHSAIEQGVDVRGYYHWSTMDLYSWVNGYDKRYGLIHVDFENNCYRTPKKSFYEFRNIADSNGQCLFK